MAPRPLRSTARLLCLLCVGLRTADAARNCYRECLPSADICMADPNKCDDTNCNTVNRPVARGPPPGYTEDLRCVASMRRERANCSSLSALHTGSKRTLPHSARDLPVGRDPAQARRSHAPREDRGAGEGLPEPHVLQHRRLLDHGLPGLPRAGAHARLPCVMQHIQFRRDSITSSSCVVRSKRRIERRYWPAAGSRT